MEADSIARKKYPNNPIAADENFDAQLFESALHRNVHAHAEQLRRIARSLSKQAEELVANADKLERQLPARVSSSKRPKPSG